uniref:Arf-GAP domain-containing protein n=1 Tax=Cyclophora tenuis TaxID=216820 RepID=A0A7S1GLL6_CYCTE|mmetsp:Transcript_20353/g.34753  ORF Transcript_20353/g.34753 Transcript_20353/m.34753 type:complete len:210 (+) Transcript_20353:672-1301(+)
MGLSGSVTTSGVHRSLGVHLSKVRSLKLDSLSAAEGRLLLAIGNTVANHIWESGLELQQGWTKPTPDASRQLKENWIKSKYQWKGFLEDRSSNNTFDPNTALYREAGRGHLRGVAEALAYGGSVDYRNETGKTPLHACAISRRQANNDHDDADADADGACWRGLECAELLLQNGAKIDTLDNDTQSVLDYAVIGNGEREMVEFLSARMS